MLERLTDFCYRHRRLVVAGWLVVLVATAVAGSRFGGGDTTDYGTPGSESKAATNLLDERFPARSGDTIDIVWRAEDVTTAAVRSQVDDRPGRGGRPRPRRRRRQPVPRGRTGPDRPGRHRRLRHRAARHLGHARRGHPAAARHRRRRQRRPGADRAGRPGGAERRARRRRRRRRRLPRRRGDPAGQLRVAAGDGPAHRHRHLRRRGRLRADRPARQRRRRARNGRRRWRR